MKQNTQRVGSKTQVWHGTAISTRGGLQKVHFMKNKQGRIVSIKQHQNGLKAFERLKTLGYAPVKGEFTLFAKKPGPNQ